MATPTLPNKLKAECLRHAHQDVTNAVNEMERIMPASMIKEYRPTIGEPYTSCPDLAVLRAALRDMDAQIKQLDPNK